MKQHTSSRSDRSGNIATLVKPFSRDELAAGIPNGLGVTDVTLVAAAQNLFSKAPALCIYPKNMHGVDQAKVEQNQYTPSEIATAYGYSDDQQVVAGPFMAKLASILSLQLPKSAHELAVLLKMATGNKADNQYSVQDFWSEILGIEAAEAIDINNLKDRVVTHFGMPKGSGNVAAVVNKLQAVIMTEQGLKASAAFSKMSGPFTMLLVFPAKGSTVESGPIDLEQFEGAKAGLYKYNERNRTFKCVATVNKLDIDLESGQYGAIVIDPSSPVARNIAAAMATGKINAEQLGFNWDRLVVARRELGNLGFAKQFAQDVIALNGGNAADTQVISTVNTTIEGAWANLSRLTYQVRTASQSSSRPPQGSGNGGRGGKAS